MLFEKSIPEAFSGESDGAPPIVIVLPMSILGTVKALVDVRISVRLELVR